MLHAKGLNDRTQWLEVVCFPLDSSNSINCATALATGCFLVLASSFSLISLFCSILASAAFVTPTFPIFSLSPSYPIAILVEGMHAGQLRWESWDFDIEPFFTYSRFSFVNNRFIINLCSLSETFIGSRWAAKSIAPYALSKYPKPPKALAKRYRAFTLSPSHSKT